MATWVNVGILTPRMSQWDTYDLPVIGNEVFRLTTVGQFNGASFGRIRTLYANDEVTQSIVFYPKEEKQIITLPIPQALKNQGWIVRHIQIRRYFTRGGSRRAALGYVRDGNWGILLEYAEDIAPNTPDDLEFDVE